MVPDAASTPDGPKCPHTPVLGGMKGCILAKCTCGRPNTITAATMPTFSATIAALNRADSLMPITRMTVMASIITPAGRLTTAPVQWRSEIPVPAIGALAHSARIGDAELVQQIEEVTRPARRHGGGGNAEFQHHVPADEPGHEPAHGGIGVGIGAAGLRDHRRQFGIAERGEETAGGGDQEGKQHRRAGMLGGDRAGDDEDAGADGGADPDQGEMHRPQRAMKLDIFGKDRIWNQGNRRVAHALFPRQIFHTVFARLGVFDGVEEIDQPVRSPSTLPAGTRYRVAGRPS